MNSAKSLYLFCALFLCITLSAQESEQGVSFSAQLLFIDNNEACALMDVNQDGLLDITAGRLWYAAPDFIGRPLRPVALHAGEYAQNNGEYRWDVDKDGWPDVVATGWEDTHIRWYKNPGKDALEKGLEWKSASLADTKNGNSEAGYMYDLDADGTPEYILNSWNKKMPFTVWRFSQNVFGDPIMIGTLVGKQNSHGVGFGDINGDGRTDIVFDDGWYEQPEKGLLADNWTLHKDFTIDHGSCPMQVVDVDGDGDNDIVWGRGHGYGLYWMEQGESKKNKTSWTNHTVDESWSQVHAMLWTDIDDDGKNELITGKRIRAHNGKDPGSSDTAQLYKYGWDSASKSFKKESLSDEHIGTGLFIRAADLNADGKKDLVVAGKTGTFILWQK